MSDIFYTEEHEYIIVEDDIGTVGISEYAQEQLGDVVYVELPEIGAVLEQKDEAGVVESVKVASEFYAPVSGEVIEINDSLDENPSLINEDTMGNGWLFKIKLSDPDELDDLQNEHIYAEHVESLS